MHGKLTIDEIVDSCSSLIHQKLQGQGNSYKLTLQLINKNLTVKQFSIKKSTPLELRSPLYPHNYHTGPL